MSVVLFSPRRAPTTWRTTARSIRSGCASSRPSRAGSSRP